MSNRDRCLRAAEQCERLARRTASAEDRNTLLNMAQLWRELAETAAADPDAELSAPTSRRQKHA